MKCSASICFCGMVGRLFGTQEYTHIHHPPTYTTHSCAHAPAHTHTHTHTHHSLAHTHQCAHTSTKKQTRQSPLTSPHIQTSKTKTRGNLIDLISPVFYSIILQFIHSFHCIPTSPTKGYI